ncbi:MAG: hypothetical protein ACFFFO_17905 [Candidatus Thorarchaeota archaeon]
MIKKKVSLLTLALVLCLMIPVMSSANQVDFVISQAGAWSDDFDDGNIDGWSVLGLDTSTNPWNSTTGNITAEDNTMRVYSEDWWSEAYRTSNVAYGSWAFDVYCVDTLNERSYIAFISGSPPLIPEDLDFPFEYGIITVVGQYESHSSAFLLYRRPSESPYLSVIGSYDVAEVSGWYHINITRDLDGNFEVYFNGTLGITVTDTTHTTCDLFTFTAEVGYALDNIVVVPIPTTTPTPPDGIPDMTLLLVVGGGIAVVVILVAVVKLRKRTD